MFINIDFLPHLVQPMPQIEHNAPKFQYRIYWKRERPGERWTIQDVADWRIKELAISQQVNIMLLFFIKGVV